MAGRGKLSGTAFVLLLAVSFAAATALARLVYDAGGNPLTVSFTRATLAAVAVLVWCRLAGARPIVGPRKGLAIVMGLMLAASSLSFYSSFQYLPVATATLLYYTFPLMTGLMLVLAGRKDSRFGIWDAIAIVLAFVGLVVALWTGGGIAADAITGIVQAAAGAVVFALILTLTRLFFGPGDDARSRILWMMAVAALAYGVLGLALGGFAWPAGTTGIAGLFGASACYAFAIVGTLFATDRMGPLPVGILLNFEPVASLFLGNAILGQVPTWLQVAGSLIVVAAILLHLLGGPTLSAISATKRGK